MHIEPIILVVSSEISFKNGWGRVSLEISKSFHKHGTKIINICGDSSKYEKKIAIKNLQSLKYWKTKKMIFTIIDLIRIIFNLKQPFNHILATDEQSLILTYWISKIYGVPYSCYLHGTYALKMLNDLNVQSHKKALTRANQIFFPSSFTANEFKKFTTLYDDKIKIIPLGVSDDFLNFPFSNKTRRNQLITIGAVKERKGLLEILQAISLIDEKHRPLINVVGKLNHADKYVSDIFKTIEKKMLKDKVIFHEQISDDAMIELMDTSSIFILPSKNTSKMNFEGFGLVFLEASSRFLPVIGSKDCGNTDSIAHNETGYLVEQGNIEELKNKIFKLLVDPNLRKKMGENGRVFSERMTWNHTIKLILKNIK